MSSETSPTKTSGRSNYVRLLPVGIFLVIAGFFALALQSGEPSKLPSMLIGKPVPRVDSMQKVLGLCAALRPVWDESAGSIDLCYWYFGAMVTAAIGGDGGAAWNRALSAALIGSQRKDSDRCAFLGSWDPVDPWSAAGGRVYSTSMAVLALEAPERIQRLLK